MSAELLASIPSKTLAFTLAEHTLRIVHENHSLNE